MDSSKAVIEACEKAENTWHQLAKECEIFNMHTKMETSGHLLRAMVTFGMSSLSKVPEIERSIESHALRTDLFLNEFRTRVGEALSVAQDGDNIFEMLISVEKHKHGTNLELSCGYTGSEEDCREYKCNIGEVAFHLIEARNFWAEGALNSAQDITQRHKMVCRTKRGFPGALKITPKLAKMPYTPLSEKLKRYISNRIKQQEPAIGEYIVSASVGAKTAMGSLARDFLKRTGNINQQ